MTSIEARPAAAIPDGDPSVEWRVTQRDLWVARRGGRHLGTIEHGRHYVATGPDGEPIGSYATLEQAKCAVMAPPERPTCGRLAPRSAAGVAVVGTVTVVIAAVAAAYALLPV